MSTRERGLRAYAPELAIVLASVLYGAETAGSPAAGAALAGPNWEGKEVRFGLAASALFAAGGTGEFP